MLVKTKQNKQKKSLFKTIAREKSKEKQRQGSALKTIKIAWALCGQSRVRGLRKVRQKSEEVFLLN